MSNLLKKKKLQIWGQKRKTRWNSPSKHVSADAGHTGGSMARLVSWERRLNASQHLIIHVHACLRECDRANNPGDQNKQWRTRKWIFKGRSHLAPRLGGRGDVYLHNGIGKWLSASAAESTPSSTAGHPPAHGSSFFFPSSFVLAVFFSWKNQCVRSRGSLFCSRTMDWVSAALILRIHFLFVRNFALIWPVTEWSVIACGHVLSRCFICF